MPGINAVTVDMSYIHSSDSGVPPLASRQRQRSPPHANPHRPHQSHPPTAPPIPLPQRSSHTPYQGVPGTLTSALTDPSTCSSAPPVTQRGSIVGHQRTLSNVHPRLHAVHSPPIAFPHHVGSPIQEQNMYLAYISPSMMLPPHAPVYQYRSQPDLVPTPSHILRSASAPTSPIYPHAFTNTSPSHSRSTSRHAVSDSLHGAHYSPPYAMHGTYTPMWYTTHPPHAYPPLASFVPASSIYGSHCPLPHYYQPYGFPTGKEGQGICWHSPPGTTVAFNSFEGTQREYPQSAAGSSPVGQLDGEPPDQRNTATLPSEPQLTLRQTHIGRSSDDVEQEATQVSSPTPLTSSRTKHQERRSYHPNPPSYRSEWVMWAGNVPSDVTQDEIREFFNQALPPLSPAHTDRRQVYGGVSAVFLISRSYCAFVNFESKAQLEAATMRFNGQPIRPHDPWCLPLVCRVRRKEDDLMAGVGGQRGSGMHIKWLKEHKAKVQRIQADTVGSQKDMMRSSSPLSVSSDDSRGRGEGRFTNTNVSRSASIASTNSDILTRYFPQRYFVLKSLTRVCIPPLLNPRHSKTHTLAVRSGPEHSEEYVGNSASQRGDSRPSISHQQGRLPHFQR
jgi:RNA recognition motif-containing protein